MKKLLPLLVLLFLFSCSDQTKPSSGEIVNDFLDNPKSLEKIQESNPIIAFQKEADQVADKVSRLNSSNIGEVLEEAKNFKHCVITVENHTIVSLGTLKDCENSGSWGECMPFGEGYIKRGDLVFQSDYINNIIGRPDDKERMVYYFQSILPQ